jgi:hypothetical protein
MCGTDIPVVREFVFAVLYVGGDFESIEAPGNINNGWSLGLQTMVFEGGGWQCGRLSEEEPL